MNTIVEEIVLLNQRIYDCLDDEDEGELRAKKDHLMEQMESVNKNDIISIPNGLKFLRMSLEKHHPEETGLIRMTKKLITQSPHDRKIKKKKTEKNHVATGAPPFKRPRGAAPKNMTWSETEGVWVPKSEDA